jgi:hypothetical protein
VTAGRCEGSTGPVDDTFTYAWSWFALHSGQRLQMVNFWLVAVAFLGTAFVQARASNLPAVAVGISGAGAVASVAFLLIDARTRELLRVAERALREIEDERFAAGASVNMRLVQQAHESRSSSASSYQVVIQGLQATMASLFIAAGIYTMFR